ncbi:MAG: hypothetical protein K8S54_21020 [Spirochaetia bacterium]|nr:hypothetical protein [Spirochaetia bacterium]
MLKSKVLETHFLLVDANRSSMVPGASGKNFRIFLRIKPEDAPLWTAGKETWITSFPKDKNWIHEILRDPALLHEVESNQFTTYFKSENGYQYTLWVSDNHRIILIRYVQN